MPLLFNRWKIRLHYKNI